ncbi:MAG TPA: tetratricopeptide repeat protein, partial [Bryobacteraceae bacterium]
YHDAQNGPPNFLMRNHRDGTFRDVTAQTSLDVHNTRYSFCCGWNDFNNDGWPDLYVVNDFGRKNLYRNNGNGTFTDVAAASGVEDIGAGMSVACFDFDNDGLEDIYSADMWTAAGERISMQPQFKADSPDAVRSLYRKHAMGNSLFRNRGPRFDDVTASSGTGIGRWSWSSDAWDFDHDGFEDLYIANGMLSGPGRDDLNSYFWRQVVANSPDTAKPSHAYEQGWNVINELIRSDGTWSGYERNVVYANNGDGTFSDVSGAIRLDFIEDCRAFALADFDHDGRQELFLKSRNAPQLRVVRNVMEPLPGAIAIRLIGQRSNRDAIGARVTLANQTRTVQAGSGFLSQHSKELFFGLGSMKGPLAISIRWPSGLVQRVENIQPEHRIWIEEGIADFRAELFRARSAASTAIPARRPEPLPVTAETWLLVPVAAPDFPALGLSALRGKPVLLTIGERLTLRHDGATRTLAAFGDIVAVYNIFYRYLFDRHRDLTLPTSFLIDADGNVVKIDQGLAGERERFARDVQRIPATSAERVALALPFGGASGTYEFGRNHLTYGAVYFQHGYFEQAEAFFRLAVRDARDNSEALYGLGSACLKLNKIADARLGFEQALKGLAANSGTKPNAFNNLGLLATREGHIGEAVAYFQQALHLDPDHLIALKNLGNAYRQQKLWDDARRTLEHALAVGPRDPEVHYSLAMVFAQTGDSARAYDCFRKALELRPAYPEALNNLGVLYLRTERRDQAVAEFEECIRVAPGFDQSYLNLARVHQIEGHPEKARAVLAELLKQRPDHPEARRMLEGMR